MEKTNEEKASKTEKNVHQGHRKRMRKKFLKDNSVMDDYEIIEMLLYNVMPQANTNVQAHKLLDKGGSLNGILELSDKEILEIDRLGENALVFIRLLRELVIRTKKEILDKGNRRKITKKNISEKLHKIFEGKTDEMFVLITTDTDCNKINEHIISSGTECMTVVPVKKIIELVLADKASFVFVAHNHPNGILAASDEDINATSVIKKALSYVDVHLIEHYIVTQKSIVGIIGMLENS